jgi:RHS repeat-associated protein
VGFPGVDPEYAGTYLHARYFDPQLGTFLSPDPIGVDGGVNQYGYGFGDPVNTADPSGLDPRCPPGSYCFYTSPDPGYDDGHVRYSVGLAMDSRPSAASCSGLVALSRQARKVQDRSRMRSSSASTPSATPDNATGTRHPPQELRPAGWSRRRS